MVFDKTAEKDNILIVSVCILLANCSISLKTACLSISDSIIIENEKMLKKIAAFQSKTNKQPRPSATLLRKGFSSAPLQ
jgi:hypothetical protein